MIQLVPLIVGHVLFSKDIPKPILKRMQPMKVKLSPEDYKEYIHEMMKG